MSSSESSYTWQQKWLAIAPKPFSLLSILGSSYILQHILSSKERRAQVYHHILIGLCTYDIIVSFTMFWGTWAIPSDTPNIYLASGTQSTCNAQAFLQQLGVAVPIYTAELALYYFLVVVFGWKERQLQKIEIVLHFIPSALGWTSSIVGIATNTFTDSVFWCWYSQDASNLRFGFFYGITWACILLVCILMGAMYITVLMQERKVKKYQHPNNVVGASTPDGTIERQTNQQQQQQQRREKKATASKRIAAQAILYSGSFFLTWLFASWARIYEMVNGKSAPFAIEALFTIFSPLQGFFNFLIYCRPRYLRYRRDNPNFSIGRFICDCGGFISSTKLRMSSKRTSNSTVRIGYNPAVVNDSSKFMTRLGIQRFTQRFHARSSKNSEDAKASAVNGNDQQHCQSSVIMKVADKGAGEIEQENDPCRRTSTVRFADGDVDMEEEEKVEETSEIP